MTTRLGQCERRCEGAHRGIVKQGSKGKVFHSGTQCSDLFRRKFPPSGTPDQCTDRTRWQKSPGGTLLN